MFAAKIVGAHPPRQAAPRPRMSPDGRRRRAVAPERAMLLQLIVSTVMVTGTVVIHGYGIAIVSWLLQGELREERVMHLPLFSARSLAVTIGLVIALLVIHGVEIWLYAFFYLSIGAIQTLEIAVYFSTISYSGIGYSDHYIAAGWRLVAGIEGINGLVLIGWSTAFFVTIIARIGR
jgi:hypothetical protein